MIEGDERVGVEGMLHTQLSCFSYCAFMNHESRLEDFLQRRESLPLFNFFSVAGGLDWNGRWSHCAAACQLPALALLEALREKFEKSANCGCLISSISFQETIH